MKIKEHGRTIENIAFGVGVALLAFAGIREALGMGPASFPWVTFIAASVLVAPKMLGRATAGRVWDLLGKKSDA